MDRPGADFLDARREVGLQAEKFVARADHAVEPRFVHAHVLEEHLLVFVVEVGDFGFGLGADGDDRRVFGGGVLLDGVKEGIVFKAVFVDVGDVHGGLDREKEERAQNGEFFLGKRHGTRGLRFVQGGKELLAGENELEGFLVAALTRLLGIAVEGLFHGGEVGERKLGVDHRDVFERIDVTGHVNDVVVLEAAHDVRDGVALADVGEKLVAEAFALARAGDETGDVDEFHDRGHDALGLDDFRKGRKARIRHFDDARVRFDRAEGIVFRGDARLRECIENGRLADVGQADDATLQTHNLVLF